MKQYLIELLNLAKSQRGQNSLDLLLALCETGQLYLLRELKTYYCLHLHSLYPQLLNKMSYLTTSQCLILNINSVSSKISLRHITAVSGTQISQ